MSKTERILVLAIAVLGVVLVTGTVWALATGAPARKAAREAVPAEPAAGGVYDGLGRIRATSSDGAVVIVHLAFPYDASDRPFREELGQKRADLRDLAARWLSSQPSDALDPAADGAVKAALRDVLNGALSLGSIEELYLAEFRVIR